MVRPAGNTSARSLIAYWLLGLCNNYGYVVMLSGAHDVLSSFGTGYDHNKDLKTESSPNGAARECNALSTGIILLADIIPGLLVKIVAPFLPLYINVRVSLIVLSSIIGFVVVGAAVNPWMAIIGVCLTSFSSGLGETTLLSYTVSFKDKNVISVWASGTGGAGIFGSFTYATFISFGVPPSTTLFILTVVPLTMAVSFWIILEHPSATVKVEKNENVDTTSKIGRNVRFDDGEGNIRDHMDELKQGLRHRLKYLPQVLPYVVPLLLVYFFEYYINQGLFELLYFKDAFLDHHSQYRWYQVLYQVGVFVSRSSISLVRIPNIWILAILQGLNAVYLTIDSIYGVTPHLLITFAIILWEGLLGGSAYVNTFYKVQTEVNPQDREFSTGMTTVGDSVGIALAGLLSIPTHNYICTLPKY